MSTTQRVLIALEMGQVFTPAQIAARFNVANPSALVNALRQQGFPVYGNRTVLADGTRTTKYRLGTASRSIIAAGYKAIAANLV
jgi:hypothetical protein